MYHDDNEEVRLDLTTKQQGKDEKPLADSTDCSRLRCAHYPMHQCRLFTVSNQDIRET